MDITQLAQMVTWLDEQHRRDRDELTKLQQRVEGQTNTLREQARRVKSLEAQLGSARMQLGRFEQIDESLQNLRNELTIMVNSQSEEMAKTRRDLEQSRMTDREAISRAIAEVRKELGRLRQLEEMQKMAQTELQRINELTMGLRHDLASIDKDIDERTRGLPYLVEQRSHDNKRIAQLQQENIELFKRLEAVASKLQSQEYKLQKAEVALPPLTETLETLKRTQAQFIDSLKLADADRQRKMDEWRDMLESQVAMLEDQRERLSKMMSIKDDVSRELVELDKFRKTLQREQSQVAALQRLAEDRMKKEIEAFKGDNEKLWKKQLLDWQYRWDQQEKLNVSISDTFPKIQHKLDMYEELLQFLWTTIDGQSQSHLRSAQQWLSQIQKLSEQREDIHKKYREVDQQR
ncbi:MAG: hypothetical protein DSY55_05720 [Clostridia bacterium]|nr:MAG: hypothetical protein DSY55_05720 [Clostridia bacterium]